MPIAGNKYLCGVGNTYFQFKQFTVHQDRCAMKVCTDSCLFGAWIPLDSGPTNILDIGTGTGLLSLMLAQRSNAAIDAIELEEAAALQAKENIASSPWHDSIRVHHEDILTFTTPKLYDLIVSNPPFYEQSVLSEDSDEQSAKHATTLTLDALLNKSAQLLHPEGKLAILLPYFRMQELIDNARQHHLYPERALKVQPTPKHAFFRCMILFGRNAIEMRTEELIIKDNDQQYSAAASALLRPFYLHL